jgi:hypothetical protein
MIRFLRNKCPQYVAGICAVFFILFAPLALSLWHAHAHGSSSTWVPEVRLRSFYLGVLAGMGLFLVLLPAAARGFAPFFAPLRHAVGTRRFWSLVIISVVCLFVVLHFADKLERKPGQAPFDSWVVLIEKNPGGIFALVTGVATVIALFYTWQGLSDIRRSISSFSDLIDRVCVMARDATFEDPLKMLAYTPAIGYLSQPITDWNRFRDALTETREGKEQVSKPIVEIVCLREGDLDVWHKLFVGRKTLAGKVDLDLATKATAAATHFLAKLSKDGDGNPITEAVRVHRLPWRFMPGFYVFITRQRAIIVTPLFLPFPKGAPKDDQEKLPPVQMIGLETQDRAIIQDAQNIFAYYRDLPNHPLGEAHELVRCDALKTWLTISAHADATIKTLQNALLTSLQSNAADINEQLAKAPNCEIALGLDAHIKTW